MASWRAKGRVSRGIALLLLLVVLPLPARAEDDAEAKLLEEERRSEEAAARYARELLVRRAELSVRPDRMEEDGVARMRDDVRESRDEFLEIDRESVEQATDLIAGEPGRGLIGEAARLYAWMNHVPAPPSLDGAAKPVDLRYPLIVFKGTDERPDFAAFVTRENEEDLPADAKASLALARRQASARLRARRLDVLRRADGRVAMLTEGRRFLDLALEAIRGGKPTEQQEDGSIESTWLALTDRHELSSRMSRAYIAAREIQVRERLAEFAGDMAPTGLVSERAVDEKRQLAERLQADVATLQARRKAMDEALNWYVDAESNLASELGNLGYKLEEADAAVRAEAKAAEERAEAEAQAEAERKAKEAEEAKKEAEKKKAEDKGSPKDEEPKEGDEPKDEEAKDADDGAEDDGAEDASEEDEAVQKSPAQIALIALQLKEGVLKLKLRLLYLAVHRVVLRAELYDKAIGLAKEEARAASDVAERYDSELSRMRRERQLELLDTEKTRLEMQLTDATSRADDPTHENRPLWILWKQVLTSLRNVNRLTRDAVRLRRAFEAEITPARPPSDETAPDATEANDPLRRFRRPDRVAFDEKYVEDARQILNDESFDKSLVSLHFMVVDERIAALESGLALVDRDFRIEAELLKESGAAEKALDELEAAAGKLTDATDRTNWIEIVTETRKEDTGTAKKAFQEMLRGLNEEAQEARSLLAACRLLREDLRGLGTRSFGIRVHRNLDGENLGRAFDDVQDTVSDATRWVSGGGESNIVTFLRANWMAVLACLALIAAAVGFVRFARRGLDRTIARIAREIPELRSEPVTVRAEEAHAKREKAEQELAAKEAEAEALRMVSKEEAGKAQKMGEGGMS